jgi:hypothetical protein
MKTGAFEEIAAENEALKSIIHDTLWMACRYAHGRQSYAVGMFNGASRKAQAMDFLPSSPEPLFALDGTLSADMSGLTSEEFEAAWRGWSDPGCVPNHCKFERAQSHLSGKVEK